MAKLFLLLTVLPLVELALLLTLGSYTSVWFTLAFVVLTGLAGAILLRLQGLQTYRNIRRDLSAGKMPTDSLIDGFMLLLAGVLLISPGVLTDFVGITLLVPFCRRTYRRWIAAWFRARWKLQTFSSSERSSAARSEVIDSYVVDRPAGDESQNPHPGPLPRGEGEAPRLT